MNCISSISAPSPFGITPASPPQGSGACQAIDTYASLSQALDEIYRRIPPPPPGPNPPPAVLAFGYPFQHENPTSPERSAAAIFTREMLPWLARREHRYQDLVVTFLPHGGAIEAEIAAFNRTGRIGPEMERILNNYLDGANYRQLLVSAHVRGIAIHAGGVNYIPGSYPSFSTDAAKQQIAANSAQVIGNLVQAGRRVASFSHLVSNAITPNFPAYAPHSFVPSLIAANPHMRIVEIDMVVPELIYNSMQMWSLCSPRYCHWRQLIPTSGTALGQGNTPNSFLLYLSPR
jgi:hypothetical protein